MVINLKTFSGNLDLNTLRNGLGYSKKFLNIIHDIDKLGKTHNIDVINKITDRLMNNKKFKQFEKVIGVGEGIIGAIETQKKSGLFNKNPEGINKVGEDYANERHKSISKNPFDEIENKFRRKKSGLNQSENDMARSIVNNIK